MQRLYVDRIEGDFAVCENEDGKIINLLLKELPKDIKDGSVLAVDDEGNTTHDYGREKERGEELFNMQNSLFDE